MPCLKYFKKRIKYAKSEALKILFVVAGFYFNIFSQIFLFIDFNKYLLSKQRVFKKRFKVHVFNIRGYTGADTLYSDS